MINILAEMELADNFKNKEYFEYCNFLIGRCVY